MTFCEKNRSPQKGLCDQKMFRHGTIFQISCDWWPSKHKRSSLYMTQQVYSDSTWNQHKWQWSYPPTIQTLGKEKSGLSREKSTFLYLKLVGVRGGRGLGLPKPGCLPNSLWAEYYIPWPRTQLSVFFFPLEVSLGLIPLGTCLWSLWDFQQQRDTTTF
jgi:hypothetical protein